MNQMTMFASTPAGVATQTNLLKPQRMSQELKTLMSSESNEWYTPAPYTYRAAQVMGGIDLDPASNPIANQWIGAKRIYTITDNGLRHPWPGRVWLNPPYGKTGNESNQAIWAAKFLGEYEAGRMTQGVMLLKAAIGYDWFDDLFHGDSFSAMCIKRGLISFMRPGGGQPGKSKLGSIFFYVGPKAEQFEQLFCDVGKVIR